VWAVATIAPSAEARSYEHLVLDFLAYLEFERGLSRNTLEAYRSDLLQFGRFLEARALNAVTARAADVSDFLTDLAAGDGNGRAPASPATVHRKAACLRSFYRHLRREGVRDSDPTATISGPRRTQRMPKVLNRDEVTKLLAQPKGSEPTSLRDRALLELMYACGLRASEAIGLDVRDLDMESGILRARGKGSKERFVPVGRAAIEAVRVYMERGRPGLLRGRLEAKLFVNFRGEPLTRQGLYKIVRRHATTADLADRMSPHTLRHTFATHLLAGGCDLRSVQEMLGHADVATTAPQANGDSARLKDVYFKSHPRATGR
jgi:integrase/recombinase XerD